MLAAILLAPLFADHMVLQRDHLNAIWGTDTPQHVVTLTVEGQVPAPVVVQVTAGADGSWQLACPALPAGGPYRLHVKGSTEAVIDDVLVGEVWLASGQSNMEFPLANANESAREIEAARWPQIRMIKIERTAESTPQRSFHGDWRVCSPETAGEFSAVGYFFARDLHQRLGVPVGVIDSTWGGTPVEAWTSREGLSSVMNLAAAAPLAPAELASRAADYQAKVAAWEKTAFPADPENTGLAQGWAKPDFDDSTWRSMPLPVLWQTRGLEFNGTIWFRRTIEVPAAWAGRDLALNLGAIDDFDRTYFNGQPVGATGVETTGAYQVRRCYVVPGKFVHPGRNVIAVRVFDRFGQGGWAGPARLMAAGPVDAEAGLPLAGDWRFAVEHEIPLVSGDVYQTAPAVPPGISTQSNAATLFNGMIAPLVPYGIRGAIWYQGEANVDDAASYRARFTAMIRDWRARWGEGDFPFFFVQLASFHATPGWPLLREAQAQTLIEPATGMAVTLDIGNPTNIHPRNKQDVGHRLALLARAQIYGEPTLEAAGPTLVCTEISGNQVRVHLSHAGGLRARGGAPAVTGFALAGADGVYHPAEARIDGAGVVVSSDAVPAPHTVRYAWADCPTANLENAAGLPAASFRTDGY